MASGDGVTSGKLLSILRNQRREMGLGGAPSPQALAQTQSQFYTFIGTLLEYVKNRWNSDDSWENGGLTARDSFGEVKFNELPIGEIARPSEILQAVAELLEEEREIIALLFPRANLEIIDSQREKLEDSHNASHAQETLEHYIEALNPEEDAKESEASEFPSTFKNRLQSERDEAVEQEKHFSTLFLQELGQKLQTEISEQTDQKQRLVATREWSAEQEDAFRALTTLGKEYTDWTNLLRADRRTAIENTILERLLISGDREKVGNRYQAVFWEHPAQEDFDATALDESKVEKAAETYWQEIYDLVVRANNIESPDQTFERGVFERTVFDTYNDLTLALQNLNTKHEAGSKTLANQIQLALGQVTTEEETPTADAGGADESTPEEESTGPTSPPDAPQNWNRRREALLTRLLDLQRESDSGDIQNQRREELSGVITSLASAADQYWGVAGTAATLEELFSLLSAFDFEAWTSQQIADNTPEVIENSFATFERLLAAAEKLLATQDQEISPGEAAARAAASQEEILAANAADQTSAQAQAATTAEQTLEQLKDIGKLTHAQSTLTELTMQILEDELRQNTVFSEAQIQEFLTQNREAVSQAVWTNYLQTLTGKVGSGDLSASMMAQIAFSSSGLFVEKINLETFGTINPITGSGANRGFTGSLPPGILERLSIVATENGYESVDELVVAMFGQGLSKEQALYKFIDLAGKSANFNDRNIADFSRLLINQQLSPAQRAAGNQVEIMLAELSQDQEGFDQFFLQLSQEQLSAETKRKWLLLRQILTESQKRDLTAKELLEAEKILTELSPLLRMYEVYGESFYALRFGAKDLNQFSQYLAEYRQYENQLAAESGPPTVAGLDGVAEYQFTIPAAFESVVFVQLQPVQPTNRSARTHLPLFLALSGNDLQKQNRLATSIEKGNNRLSKQVNLAQWQRSTGAAWSDDMHRSGGGVGGQNMRSVARLAAKSKKGGLFKALIKNRAAVTALVSTASAAAGAVMSAVAAAMPYIMFAMGAYVVANALAGAAQSIFSFVSGIFTGAGNVISGIFGGGIPLAKSTSASFASGSSIRFNNWLKANSQTASQAATSTGSTANAIIQSTSIAGISGALVTAGIIFPIVLTAMLTIIVWMVIANSFNDMPSGGIVRSGALSRNYCAADNPSLVATAKGIVADLQPGWWKYYNRHPAYPELFNTVLFNAYPRKDGVSSGGRTEPDYYLVQNQSSSIQSDLFWCTWLVVKTYQINNLPIGQHIFVPTMLSRWSAGPVVKNKAEVPGGGNVLDAPITANSIPLGAAIFFGKPGAFNAGNRVPGGAHVAIVCDIEFDDAAQTTGTLTTCDSNNYRTLNKFDIINGQVQDTETLTVDYFGLPGDVAPSCGPGGPAPEVPLGPSPPPETTTP